MRCLHIISGDLWAGAEVATLHLLAELRTRRGVDLEVVIFNRGELQTRLADLGISTTVLDERVHSIPALAGAVSALARAWRADVVHSHRYKEHVVGAVAALRSGAFHVRTAHGEDMGVGWDGRLVGMGPLVDRALGWLTGGTWITVSGELGEGLRGFRRTVHVVGNGLPDEPPTPRRSALVDSFGDGRPAWYVGFVGRLEPEKRPDRFVRAFAELPAEIEGRTARGVLLGSGSQDARLRGTVRDLGIEDRVRFLGHRANGDSILAGLDVLVIPSDREGMPMVLLEAMRSGVAVVACRVGGMGEILGETEYVVRPEDERSMTSAIRTLLEDRGKREAWSEALRSLFLDRCSIRRVADRVLEVYAEGVPESAHESVGA
jgi:glycosyltransferase involved in cell wall biosynthesis